MSDEQLKWQVALRFYGIEPEVRINKLVAFDARNGRSLKEIELGPILCGPSVSRGRVYVGTGNTYFSAGPEEAYFPKRNTGFVYSFGLPDEGNVDSTIKKAISTVDEDRPLSNSF